jgi:hypothetical protein
MVIMKIPTITARMARISRLVFEVSLIFKPPKYEVDGS